MDADALDLLARKIVMASYLYYRQDESVVTDAEFDRMCRTVADNWEKLSPLRKWQLDSPDAIRASGFRVKVTAATEAGAWAWCKKITGHLPGSPAGPLVKWRFSKRHKVHWATLGG